MSLLSRRRALMFLQNSKLPSDYQLLEYIESTGTQYIEIDYIASSTTNSKGVFQITDTSRAGSIFGSRVSAQQRGYVLNWGGSTPYKFYNSFYSNALTNKQIDNEKHSFEKNGLKLYIDNNLIHTHSSVEAFTTPTKLLIFGCNTNGTFSIPVSVKLYSLQFYDDNILKVSLIPCFRKSDKIAGLFDVVNQKFYTSKSEDNFIFNYTDNLSDYQVVDYIESDGAQYINTGVIPTEAITIESKFQLTKIGANYPFGVRTGSQKEICYVSGGASVWNFRYGLISDCTYGETDMNIHNINMGIDGVYFDNELVDSPDTSPFTCMGSLYLFALNNNGSVSYGKTKIYSFKMYNGGVLIKDFIPCYHKKYGIVGMFDTINSHFYTNQGTGEFIIGGEV